jgi:hypothetical protein
MRTLRLLAGLATLAFLVFVAACDAQEKQPVAEKHDAHALADALRDVINTGADLFNKYGDYAGCYRVYQGGLTSIKPFLTPDLQKKIDQAMARAETLPKYSDRAFELRAVLGEIRDKSMGAPAEAAKKGEKVVGPNKEGKTAKATKETTKPGVIVDANAGQIAGKVTYEGKPAPPGFVTLVSDSQRFSASIAEDGTYSFKTPIPPGKYKIAIERVPGAKIPPNLDIPERFRKEATSGVTFEVPRGRSILDIDLRK